MNKLDLVEVIDALADALEPFAELWRKLEAGTNQEYLDGMVDSPVSHGLGSTYQGPKYGDCKCAAEALGKLKAWSD